MCFIKKIWIFIFFCLLSLSTLVYGTNTHCPREAIHCVFGETNHPAKWIKVTMLPKNIVMVLCMHDNHVLYLEKDDIEQDGTLPGAVLTWQLSQCSDESCLQSQPIGTDQFQLLYVNDHYIANPPVYLFNVNPYYGNTCL